MSFATEPIQLPIVPLSLFSLHALRTNLSSKRRYYAPRRPVRAAAAQSRRAAHKLWRSVSLPSSAGSVPSRRFAQMLLRPRAVLRDTLL